MASAQTNPQKVYQVEHSIAWVRIAIIVTSLFAYTFLVEPAGVRPTIAYALLAAALAYALGVYFFEPYRRLPLAPTLGIMVASDAAFALLWIWATGSFASPFYLILFVVVASFGYRYGAGITLAATLLYGLGYTALLAAQGQLAPHGDTVLVRLAFVFLVGTVAALHSRSEHDEERQRRQTERLADELKASEGRFRTVVENTPDFVVVLDAADRIEYINRVRDESIPVRGESAFSFLPDDQQEEARRRLASVRTTGRTEGWEVVADAPGEGLRIFSVRMAPIHDDGRPNRILAIATDITERKRMDQERLARVEQAREVQQLREISRVRTQFLNSAAHELATPLTPILLQLHLWQQGALGRLRDDQQRSLDVLTRNFERLRLLTQDLLEAARLQSGKIGLKRKTVDLAGLVHDAVETFEPRARQRGSHLQANVPGPVPVDADPTRIFEVLTNLLDNAIKYSPVGARIRIDVEARDDAAVVRVRDTGIGLDDKQLAHLFEPFRQLHMDRPAAVGGTGLGLYISKGLVELHGGRLWAESPGANQGSTFSFSLPTRAPEPGEPVVAAL